MQVESILTFRACMAARSTPNSLLFLYCSSDSSRKPHASSTAARLNAISPSSGARDEATLDNYLLESRMGTSNTLYSTHRKWCNARSGRLTGETMYALAKSDSSNEQGATL